MDFLLNIWMWFNGNKTQLGALCIALVALEGDLFGQPWLETSLTWLGGVLGSTGVLHKIAKGGK